MRRAGPTDSIASLADELEWQEREERRRNARLPKGLTWADLEPLRLCVLEIVTLPIREKGIALPTSLRNRLLEAGLKVWPEREAPPKRSAEPKP